MRDWESLPVDIREALEEYGDAWWDYGDRDVTGDALDAAGERLADVLAPYLRDAALGRVVRPQVRVDQDAYRAWKLHFGPPMKLPPTTTWQTTVDEAVALLAGEVVMVSVRRGGFGRMPPDAAS